MLITDIIDAICHDSRPDAEVLDLVRSISATQDLSLLLDEYNWDDGFNVPTAIALHHCADLGIALQLYWLGDAYSWYESEERPDQYNLQHWNFSQLISQRILSGCYPLGSVTFEPGFSRVEIYEFKKQNLPEVFYTPVKGRASGA